MRLDPGSRIAVTGGTGFIGSCFTREALLRGYTIRLLSRSPGRRDDVEMRHFDLAASAPVPTDVLEGCDAVVHLAAHIPRSHSAPAEAQTCWTINALGTLRLIQAMRVAGVKRLIQTTSANAYHPGYAFPDERAAMFPVGRVFYLASKIAQELYAEFECGAAGIDVATLRVSSAYGPEQASGAVYSIASKLLHGEKVILENGGRFGADFVFVTDVCAALLLVLQQGASGAYNVGSGVRSTVAQITETLCMLSGANDAAVSLDEDAQASDPGFPALNISKIAALGYRPTPLKEGLQLTLDWVKERAEGRSP